MSLRHTWKACAALFRIRMAEGLQYRMAALSGVLVSVLWAMLECIILWVFFTYGERGAWNAGGMTLEQTMSYVWLAQGLFLLQSMNIDGDIMAKINSGDVGIELCRPLDLYAHWFAKSAAGKLGFVWIRSVLTVTAGVLMPAAIALGPPASAAGLIAFAASAVLAFGLCTSFAMFVTAVRLNITWGNGPSYILLLISGVLSGTYLPLRLWPDFMQTFLALQPFGGFVDIPAQLYVGSLPPEAALPRMGLQLAWMLVFIAAGRRIMSRKVKSIIVQGG